MTNKKNTITRATALAYAIEHIDNPEVVEVLTKMHVQVTKPRAKSNTPSKAHIANVTAVMRIAVDNGEVVRNKDGKVVTYTVE